MRNGKGQQGFVYIDVLVGMVILTIALTAFAVAYQQSTRGTAAASQNTVATHLAMETLENLKRYEGTGSTTRASAEWQTTGSAKVNHVQYQVTTSVIADRELTSTQIAANSRIIPVQVTVAWATGSVTMITYYGQ